MPDMNAMVPRDPQRARGKARFESLLDAVDVLLADREPDAVTIQDAAARAGVPLASVYHYFPSNVALLVGLGRRYVLELEAQMAAAPLVHRGLRSWTDICRTHAGQACRYYGEHPVAMKLLFGPGSVSQLREMDLEANLRFAHMQLATYRRHFVIPEGDMLVEYCAVALSISDSVLSVSYSRHRTITDELAEEALQARIAYLCLYLPERAEKRTAPLP